jgi:hypothetical protein
MICVLTRIEELLLVLQKKIHNERGAGVASFFSDGC